MKLLEKYYFVFATTVFVLYIYYNNRYFFILNRKKKNSVRSECEIADGSRCVNSARELVMDGEQKKKNNMEESETKRMNVEFFF